MQKLFLNGLVHHKGQQQEANCDMNEMRKNNHNAAKDHNNDQHTGYEGSLPSTTVLGEPTNKCLTFVTQVTKCFPVPSVKKTQIAGAQRAQEKTVIKQNNEWTVSGWLSDT